MTAISSSRSLLYLKTLAPSSSASSTPTPGLFISFPHRAAAASAFGRRGEAIRSGNQRPPALRAMAADREYSSRRSSGSSNTESKERNLLPGCDLSHWLVLTDFPKEPAPTREQMIETCLNTLAAVLGRNHKFTMPPKPKDIGWSHGEPYGGDNREPKCNYCGRVLERRCYPPKTAPCSYNRRGRSMEEAKKNMYAFSTTTYTGFQCTVAEETFEKF